MSLKDVPIKTEYRSPVDNVATDFFIPLLKQAVLYKRAVGRNPYYLTGDAAACERTTQKVGWYGVL